MTSHSEHYLANQPARMMLLSRLATSYEPDATGAKPGSTLVRLQHLREVLNKANHTLERVLNHRQKFAAADKTNIELQILEQYLSIVTSITDLDKLREVTIAERRSDFLLKPLLQAMALIVANTKTSTANTYLETHILTNPEMKKQLESLFWRAVELWKAEIVSQDDAVTIVIVGLRLLKDSPEAHLKVAKCLESTLETLKDGSDKTVFIEESREKTLFLKTALGHLL